MNIRTLQAHAKVMGLVVKEEEVIKDGTKDLYYVVYHGNDEILRTEAYSDTISEILAGIEIGIEIERERERARA
jgi:hypothetical protein